MMKVPCGKFGRGISWSLLGSSVLDQWEVSANDETFSLNYYKVLELTLRVGGGGEGKGEGRAMPRCRDAESRS
jgi:hypothetical protein